MPKCQSSYAQVWINRYERFFLTFLDVVIFDAGFYVVVAEAEVNVAAVADYDD